MKVNEATFCFSSHCVFIAVQILYHPHLKGVSDKIITQNLGASQQPALTQEVLVLLSPPVPHLQTSKSLCVCHLLGHHTRERAGADPSHPDWGSVSHDVLQATLQVTLFGIQHLQE